MAPVRFLAILCSVFGFFHSGSAQTNTTTDPTEVRALNMIFAKWGISSSMSKSSWNTTGDPCSGFALNADMNLRDDYVRFNPSILCDCSERDGTRCHIIRLTAFKLNITGTIPEELKYLSKMENLQIADNYLTGPLPAFIGNFSAMKYMSIGKNALSGPVPKELGNLKNLISLGMGMNNFSGRLPPEFGNLENLEQIYIDSIGVSGEIPSTFGKLKKLKIMWASDNNFGGKVPDFLGNLTKLTTLRIQGNSFHGPIPMVLENLITLEELRLGDLTNGTSSLSFIKKLKSLTTLILRNCKISSTIPSFIEDFRNLKYLDLSFNNITGALPPFLFNMPSLKTLYLGNNSISGNLPENIGNLVNIDLSYNELSGSIPTWANNNELVNLVSNKFARNDLQIDFLRGLECLQENVPCLGSQPHYSFAINCGGEEVVSSEGIKYDKDSEMLTTASYYVTTDKKWAVSSTGSYVESQNPNYTVDTSVNITGTSDPKLFQAARTSPSSLRYYGLGLQTGNYSVLLQFAETVFTNDGLLKSSGKRVFDIYVQGNLVAKDFDIKKEAGGIPFKAIKKEYNASVHDSVLEIHFFWSGKGTCCLPTQGYYGPLVSAISVTPNFKPIIAPKRNKTAIIVGVTIAVLVFLSMLILGACLCIRRRRSDTNEDTELQGLVGAPHSFSFSDLKVATGNFKTENKLGEGGFGPVFKGVLTDGKVVAVKQLLVASLQGKRQFVTEVATISAVKHRNLVKLYGCCFEGDNRLLVYEYLENKSLDRTLFGKSALNFDWPTRFNICLGTARGLAYLHEESRVRIVHRDIKSSNILLDADLTPKISDFGLAKLYDDDVTHISTRVAGTIGYLAPEYAMRGHLTEKVDVFGFGVVALEVLCGRPNTDTKLSGDQIYLLEWAWTLHEKMRDLDMLDPTLTSVNKDEAMRLISVAFLCTQANPMLRPTMSRVVAMLVGDMEVSDVPSKPSYLTDWQFDDISSQATTSTFPSSTGVTTTNLPSPSNHMSGPGEGR